MIYAVELLIDDGTRHLRFFDTPQEAHALFDRAFSPWTDGVPIKGGKGAFVEGARLFSAQTTDRKEAKERIEAGTADLIRDSEQEKKAALDDLDLDF